MKMQDRIRCCRIWLDYVSAQCPHLQKLGQADSQQPQAANLQNMTAAHPLDVQQSVVKGIVGRRTAG